MVDSKLIVNVFLGAAILSSLVNIFKPELLWTRGYYPKDTPAGDADWLFLVKVLGVQGVLANLWYLGRIPAECAFAASYAALAYLSHATYGKVADSLCVVAPIIVVIMYLLHGNKNASGNVPKAQKEVGEALLRLFTLVTAAVNLTLLACPHCMKDSTQFFPNGIKAPHAQLVMTLRVMGAVNAGMCCSFLMRKEDNRLFGLFEAGLGMIFANFVANKFAAPYGMIVGVVAVLVSGYALFDLNGPRLVDCDALLFINDALEGRAKSVSASPAKSTKSKSRRAKKN